MRQTHLRKDLRRLRGMAEDIADIAAFRRLHAEFFARDAHAHAEILNHALAGDQVFVRHAVPRAHAQPPRAQQARQLRAALGHDFQIILQNDRLAVEMKRSEFRIGVQAVQQLVHHAHQIVSEALKALEPFAIPVRSGIEIDLHSIHPF